MEGRGQAEMRQVMVERSKESGKGETHPDRGLLERFMRGEVSPPEKLSVVRHLLAGCASCVAVTRHLWFLAGGRSLPAAAEVEPPSPDRYRIAFERAGQLGELREQAIAAERAAAPGLLRGLLGKPWERRLALVRREERYQSVALAELLLEETGAERLSSLELAVAVAERLDPQLCGPSVVRDLLRRAWTRLGESRREAGDLPGAERAVRRALALLAETPPLERLDLLRLEAALAADQGRFPEAGAFLQRAAEACREAGQRHLEGSVLGELGTLQAAAGRYPRAMSA